MMIRNLLLLLILAYLLPAQVIRKGIMQEEHEKYKIFGAHTEEFWDSIRTKELNRFIDFQSKQSSGTNTCTLTKRVFGWHPYWVGSAYQNYQWAYLSDLCYFNYEVNPSSGQNSNASFAWTTASVVTVAKNQGKKIHICATLFSNHSTFWASTSAQNTFINNIISLLNARGGDGVNIDFEGMGASDKVPFVNFITNLNNALHNANPNYELSICLYAVDWSTTFNIPALDNLVDFYTIMGYEYYWSGSSQAGPTDPMYNFVTSYNYTLSKTITYYIKQGATPSKLLMGLPYYGREWEVTGTTVPANTTGNFSSSRTLAYINNNPTIYSASNKFWDSNSFTPFYKYVQSGNNRQCFINDVYSLGRRYDMVNQRGLGGIAIWALGYDDGMTSFWNLIKDKFTTCASDVCLDSLYDMGGPNRNYYDNENYGYVIGVPSGSLVKLQFYSFNIENGYDSLWLYNGPNQSAPLIGAYTGTQSPGTFTAATNKVFLRFKSDAATNTFGFRIYKSCATPNTTSIFNNDSELYDISIFPNPCHDILNVSFSNIFEFPHFIDIFNIQGQNVKHIELTESVNEIFVDTRNWPSGIYFLKFRNNRQGILFKKIIKE
ncbi:MAG: glycosyl hydrolase family 18 protein [Bacteroidia bacterium]|nr:glycosyl hydrolase family 18 protein [Bacteroidia bacterium]